jgi:hypothetical protein
VDSAVVPKIVVLGVTINTEGIPDDHFRSAGGKPVSSVDFFRMVEPGDIVSAKGIQQAGSIAWSDIALE